MTKPRRPRPAKILSAFQLAKGALRDFRAGWKRYLLIASVITVPYNLIGLSQNLNKNPAVGAYGYVALLILNVAMLYAAIHQEREGTVPRPGAAYYDGSALIVRLLVICAILVVMLIPFVVGLVLFTVAANTPLAGTAELLLIGFVTLLIAAPSFILFTRFGLAPVISAATGLRPLAALRYSRELTLRRFWPVFSRYAGLLLFIIILDLPIAFVAALLVVINLGPLAAFLFGLISTFLAVPLLNLYLLRFYRNLEATMPTAEPAA